MEVESVTNSQPLNPPSPYSSADCRGEAYDSQHYPKTATLERKQWVESSRNIESIESELFLSCVFVAVYFLLLLGCFLAGQLREDMVALQASTSTDRLFRCKATEESQLLQSFPLLLVQFLFKATPRAL